MAHVITPMFVLTIPMANVIKPMLLFNHSNGKRYKTTVFNFLIIPMANVIKPCVLVFVYILMANAIKPMFLFNYSDGKRYNTILLYSDTSDIKP